MSLKTARGASPKGSIPKFPRTPVEEAPNQPLDVVIKTLDTQFPFLYIQPNPKRVLINNFNTLCQLAASAVYVICFFYLAGG